MSLSVTLIFRFAGRRTSEGILAQALGSLVQHVAGVRLGEVELFDGPRVIPRSYATPRVRTEGRVWLQERAQGASDDGTGSGWAHAEIWVPRLVPTYRFSHPRKSRPEPALSNASLLAVPAGTAARDVRPATVDQLFYQLDDGKVLYRTAKDVMRENLRLLVAEAEALAVPGRLSVVAHGALYNGENPHTAFLAGANTPTELLRLLLGPHTALRDDETGTVLEALEACDGIECHQGREITVVYDAGHGAVGSLKRLTEVLSTLLERRT